MKALIFVKPSERLPSKHLAILCGEPMYRRISRTLGETEYFESVTLFSKYEGVEFEGISVVRDDSQGVLIDSILRAIEIFGEFLAVGGDMPMIDSKLVSRLMKSYKGVPVAAVDYEGNIEPLFAVYNKSVLQSLLLHSKVNKRIFPFLEKEFKLVKFDEHESTGLFNVNTKDDLAKARKLMNCLETD